MTDLYINGKIVHIKESTRFKLKEENPYFTQSDKYTLDVEIPLKGNSNNLQVFQHINRMDVKKRCESMKARLVSDNKILLDGIATITQITDKSLKLQLLSGNAELNFFSKNNDIYVDEMELGEIEYESKFEGYAETNGVFFDLAKISETERLKRAFGEYGETDYVLFPIYNESEDKVYNDFCIRKTGKDTETIWLPHFLYANTTPVDSSLTKISGKSVCVPQPYWCFMIKKIFEALGYEVVENQIELTKLKNCFIANSKPTLHLNKMMPHWKLNDLLTQLEYFFGVLFIIDDGKKAIRILLRNNYFTLEKTYLNEILDEYTVACEKDNTTDISNGNIGYSFENNDAYLKVSEDILGKVEILQFDTYKLLQEYYSSLSETNKAKYIFASGGKQYIHFIEGKTGRLKEINQFRNLIRNETTTVDIELNIVPVTMRAAKVRWEGVAYDSFYQRYYPTEGVEVDAVMMQVMGGEQYAETDFNVQEAIEGEVITESNKSNIEVAMNDGMFQKVTKEKDSHPFPWPFVLTCDLLTGENNRGFSFELNKVEGRETMYNTVFGSVFHINTQSEIYFRFLADKKYDTMRRFIINNKTYVCKLIEYQIDDQSVKKEKVGYFYEYNDE